MAVQRLELWINGEHRATLLTNAEDVQKWQRKDWLGRYLQGSKTFEIREYDDKNKPDRRNAGASGGNYA